MRELLKELLQRQLEDLRSTLQHEANQSILKKDHAQGMFALGGIDALDRLERQLAFTLGAPAPKRFPVVRGVRKA